MDKNQYLKRITYSGQLDTSIEVLKKLHHLHLLNVPFENLDIHYSRKIKLDKGHLYEKIVQNNRGGFCYELNGLFYVLLKSLNFDVILVSCRVYKEENVYSPEFDHCAIIATIDKTKYLVDVGFGDFIMEPLKIDLELIQQDPNGEFMIDRYKKYFRVNKVDKGQIIPCYLFTTVSRAITDFKDRCYFQQYHKDSHFRSKRLISMPKENGRITIAGDQLKIKNNNKVTEVELNTEVEFIKYLSQLFQVRIQ